MKDLKFAGSQTIGEGEYAGISSSGSLKIEGNISCTDLSCSGSCKSSGAIDCSGDVKVSGSFHSDGVLKAQTLHCSGSTALGAFDGKDMKISGNFSSQGPVKAGLMDVSGSIAAEAIEADHLKCSGAIAVSGQINADDIDILIPPVTGSRADSIVGGHILIRPSWEKKLFNLTGTRLNTSLIEGDDIEIDCVNAGTVRGARIKIGKKCKIDRLEYSESITVAPGADVAKTVKL